MYDIINESGYSLDSLIGMFPNKGWFTIPTLNDCIHLTILEPIPLPIEFSQLIPNFKEVNEFISEINKNRK